MARHHQYDRPSIRLLVRSGRNGNSNARFLYLNDSKIARFYPERGSVEFLDSQNHGRVVEVSAVELARELVRLSENEQ